MRLELNTLATTSDGADDTRVTATNAAKYTIELLCVELAGAADAVVAAGIVADDVGGPIAGVRTMLK